ncbi:hypothetical protein TOPH_05341 [Tolypocladium ophioglossoides CBS 100239]|uniref:Uncharacterized protein n=1 Tax=Tolypocladium ophioglossoides (strain CBS 100239) TaxID=1163406 RepID=A0A0L0N7C7_TOLOC|nr:hypothetical protein TOPH_05341 [Tolypocladium ophioglossoides CBS 100239]
MDASTSKSFLIAVGVISGVHLLATLASILRKSSRYGGGLRFLAVVPFAIYGGIAVQGAFKQRYDAHGPLSRQGPVWLGQAMHGVVGIALVLWALVGGVVFQRSKKGHAPFAFRWEDGRRSSAGFYLAVVDACYFVCVAIALGVASAFTPWHFDQCGGYDVYDAWPVTEAGRAGECRRMQTMQILAVLFALILPLLAPPSAVRAQLFFVARALRLRRRSARRDAAAWHDLEKAALHDAGRDEKASLVAVFREDAIAASLANHLHFDDVANVSRTSRTMRRAVLHPAPGRGEQRFDMLCESACMAGAEKSECWACARLLCDDCKVDRHWLTRPRTEDHLAHCYALCTKCYMVRPGARPAPFSATWNPRDLAVQHSACASATADAPLAPLGVPVAVCPSCARLDDAAVVRVREGREEADMRLALGRRVRCKRCERALPRGRKRWWICGRGLHECHWAGHEAM